MPNCDEVKVSRTLLGATEVQLLSALCYVAEEEKGGVRVVLRHLRDALSAPPPPTAPEARDAFLKNLLHEKTTEDFTRICDTADKLLDLVCKPSMLHAFTLVQLELAALHSEDKLLVPEIVIAQKVQP